MKKLLIPLIVITISDATLAQSKGWQDYITITYDVKGEDSPEGYSEKPFFWGNSRDLAVYKFSNIFQESVDNKEEHQRIALAKEQALAKLSIIKSQYNQYDSYPDSIINGWHSAIATDNLNFCKDVKVLIKDNKVIRFVIDNYIPLDFMALGVVKKAKNVITLKNFNGEQLNIVEIYFVYELEEPRLVEAPLKPGYVCFWTNDKHYAAIQLKLDDVRMERLSVRFEANPDCFSKGMVCRILKPGTYSYFAAGRGAISWKDTFKIKENMCVKIKLDRHF